MIQNIIQALSTSNRMLASNELQSARMRVILGSVITAYLYIGNLFTTEDITSDFVLYCVTTFLVVALLIYAWTLHSPGRHPLRPVFGFSFDLSVGTALMISGGAGTAWIYGGFLWTTIAAGMRFGRPYLFTATILAVIGFSLVLVLSPFWVEHSIMGIGLLVWLMVLPLYIGKLLSNLEQAVKTADIANQAKSRFLANMSHEIRTPLTAIIGYAEAALEKDQDTQERLNALSVIENSGHHLLSLINDILDFSKIEADEMDIEQIRLSPIRILADVEAITATQAVQKNLQFKVDYLFPLPAEITGDPVRLRQILFNLSSNAIKFTKQGSITLQLHALAGQNSLRFAIRDTGIGITAEQLKIIFEPFKQADSSTTRHFGGTGLGLSLSKKLTDLMGGQLHVESTPGVGTCFYLDIPCGHAGPLLHNLDEVNFETDTDDQTSSQNSLSGSVLLVEDNITNQKLISSILTRMGATVQTADNGRQAMELALQQHFDLIYMDMQMPVMSGVEATRSLRKQNYHAPIIALTANVTREDRQACLDAGCNDYLTKPVNRHRLYVTTARYLKPGEIQAPDERMRPMYSQLINTDSVITDLLGDFIAELSRMLTHIKMAFVDEQWQEMEETVHDLKGMGGGFGYPQLSDLAASLEEQLKKRDFDSVRLLLNELDMMCTRINLGKLPNNNCA